MADYLCIRIVVDGTDQPGESSIVDWAMLSSSGELQSEIEQSPLFEIASALPEGNFKCLFIVPGESILLTHVNMPARQSRQIQQALPYMVEEQVADSVESLHLVAGPRLDNGEIAVAAVRHEVMESWMQQLEQAGVKPDVVVSDSLLLPSLKKGMHILVDDTRAVVSDQKNQGMVVDFENLDAVIDLLMSQHEEGDITKVEITADSDNLAEHSVALSSLETELLQNHELDVEINELDRNTFEYLAEKAIHTKKYINLLEGRYQVKKSGDNSLRRWRPVAIAAGIALALQMGFDIAKGAYFNQQADELDNRIVAFYKELFPDAKKIVNVRSQMQSRLNNAADTQVDIGFIGLLGNAAMELKSMGKLADMQIQQLRYDTQRQNLMMDIQVKSIEQLEAYKQRLIAKGLGVDILSANEENSGVRGKLRIGGGNS